MCLLGCIIYLEFKILMKRKITEQRWERDGCVPGQGDQNSRCGLLRELGKAPTRREGKEGGVWRKRGRRGGRGRAQGAG